MCNTSNSRPISQTNVACKIIKRVVIVDVLVNLFNNNILTMQQHGFLSRRSTNLIESLSDWSLAIEDRHRVNVAYINLIKAFDVANYRKLVCTLNLLCFERNLLNWIACFGTGCTQKTRLGYSCSASRNVTSDVLKGRCLGPLLFLPHINDVINLTHEGVVTQLYPGDIKLYGVAQSDMDELRLLNRFDNLMAWCLP